MKRALPLELQPLAGLTEETSGCTEVFFWPTLPPLVPNEGTSFPFSSLPKRFEQDERIGPASNWYLLFS